MKKKLNVEPSLERLAEIFGQNGYRLYIVGGFVRNALMGFCETDIDVCSAARAEQIEQILSGTDFLCEMINPKLGTLHIFDQSKNFEYEHTTFRSEKYTVGGMHSPDDVEFVQDIRQDASRRDFSINALYYDILGHEILDFYHGINCVKKCLVQTVETPEIVFSRDGLRILRMVRLASELNFDIDEHTFAVAKDLVSQLRAISPERFNKEIIAMLFADNKYKAIYNPGMQTRGVRLLGELRAWEYVLPDFFRALDEEQKAKLHSLDWHMLATSPPALRVASFVIDIFVGLDLQPDVGSVSAILGQDGVRLNKRQVAHQSELVRAFWLVKKETFKTQKDIRLFLQANSRSLHELFGLLRLANIGAEVLRVYELMTLDHTPLSIGDLAIDGNDILAEYPEIPPASLGRIFAMLLAMCAVMPEMNKRDALLDAVADYL